MNNSDSLGADIFIATDSSFFQSTQFVYCQQEEILASTSALCVNWCNSIAQVAISYTNVVEEGEAARVKVNALGVLAWLFCSYRGFCPLPEGVFAFRS